MEKLEAEKIDKPWGFELIWAKSKRYVGKILHINAGNRLSLQYHKEKEETIFVMKGILALWEDENDKNVKFLSPGETYHVKPGQVHRFGAANDLDCTLMEVSTPEIDDVVRIVDDYERKDD